MFLSEKTSMVSTAVCLLNLVLTFIFGIKSKEMIWDVSFNLVLRLAMALILFFMPCTDIIFF